MNRFGQSLFALIVQAAAGDARQEELAIHGNRLTVEHWFKTGALASQ